MASVKCLATPACMVCMSSLDEAGIQFNPPLDVSQFNLEIFQNVDSGIVTNGCGHLLHRSCLLDWSIREMLQTREYISTESITLSQFKQRFRVICPACKRHEGAKWNARLNPIRLRYSEIDVPIMDKLENLQSQAVLSQLLDDVDEDKLLDMKYVSERFQRTNLIVETAKLDFDKYKRKANVVFKNLEKEKNRRIHHLEEEIRKEIRKSTKWIEIQKGLKSANIPEYIRESAVALATSVSQVSALNRRNYEHEKEIEDLGKKVAELEKRNEDLIGEEEKRNLAVRNERKKTALISAQLKTKEDSLNTLKRQIESEDVERKKLRSELHDTNIELMKMRKEKGDLEKLLNEAKNEAHDEGGRNNRNVARIYRMLKKVAQTVESSVRELE